MGEILRQVVIALRGMWRYRWLGLAVAWLVGGIGVVIVTQISDKYEASARIFVNTASILRPLMSGLTVQPNDDQRIAMLSRIVISRPNVEKLVQIVGFDANVKSKDEYERLIDSVLKTLDIKTAGRDNLYTLSFRDVNPERAKRVVQQFSSMFIESGHDGKVNDSDAAKKFIEEQIAIYEKKLLEAENRLKEFKLRTFGATGSEGRDYFARMTEASALFEKAQLDLREAENTRDAFRKGLANEDAGDTRSSNAGVQPSAALGELDARIDAMRRNLDLLLQKYTESHPDVVGAKRVISDLEEQRRQVQNQRKSDGASFPVTAANGGPRASEQLKVSLAMAEATVASLRARVAEYSSRYNRLKASATMMPQVEAEYAQLNRDYDINKKAYESLVSRRESANISGEMQSVTGIADFRLIDPPRVSPRPVSPNRNLLLQLSLAIAVASGLLTAFIAREIRPTFYDGRALSEATGLPVLGAVSLLVSASRRVAIRRSAMRFIMGLGLLVGAYAAAFGALLFLSTRAV